mmetsp:Transcript_56925/g.133490  ORF Transcript_56925/g.133490 Transcript_56925/m.133490 type:complete len:251 (+) Transcript_56925:121-873(+)
MVTTTARIIMTSARLRMKSWCAACSLRLFSRYSWSSCVRRSLMSFSSILFSLSLSFTVLRSVTFFVRSKSSRNSETSARVATACSKSGLICAPTELLMALRPAKAMVRTMPGASSSLEATAMPTTGHPSPSWRTQACPDPSHLGPRYSPLFTLPSTQTGTCPRKQHQCPCSSSSGVGSGSPFHFALSSDTTRKILPSSGVPSGRILPSRSMTTLPFLNFPTPSSRKKKYAWSPLEFWFHMLCIAPVTLPV